MANPPHGLTKKTESQLDCSEEWVEGADIWVLSVAKRQGGESLCCFVAVIGGTWMSQKKLVKVY